MSRKDLAVLILGVLALWLIVGLIAWAISTISYKRHFKRFEYWRLNSPLGSPQPKHTRTYRWSSAVLPYTLHLFGLIVLFIPYGIGRLRQQRALARQDEEQRRERIAKRAAEEAQAAERTEARSNAQWVQLDQYRWVLRGTSDAGALYEFATMTIQKLAHGLYALNRGRSQCAYGRHFQHSMWAINDNTVIGSLEWAQDFAKICAEGFIPQLVCVSDRANERVERRHHNVMDVPANQLVDVGTLDFHKEWEAGQLAISYLRKAYDDAPDMWHLAWFGHGPDLHLALSTDEVAQAISDSIEALQQGMPPRKGLWANVNQSA